MENENKTKLDVELVEVPTQTDLAFKKDEKVLNMHEVICDIYNLLIQIEKKL